MASAEEPTTAARNSGGGGAVPSQASLLEQLRETHECWKGEVRALEQLHARAAAAGDTEHAGDLAARITRCAQPPPSLTPPSFKLQNLAAAHCSCR
jgi:hypothetical protein